jgi:hypothetical protein
VVQHVQALQAAAAAEAATVTAHSASVAAGEGHIRRSSAAPAVPALPPPIPPAPGTWRTLQSYAHLGSEHISSSSSLTSLQHPAASFSAGSGGGVLRRGGVWQGVMRRPRVAEPQQQQQQEDVATGCGRGCDAESVAGSDVTGATSCVGGGVRLCAGVLPPGCSVMKLVLSGGQRCRPSLLTSYMQPWRWSGAEPGGGVGGSGALPVALTAAADAAIE